MSADAPPPWPRTGTSLDDVNAAFHGAYDGARARAETDAPVFVLIDDGLVVFHRGEERRVSVTPRLFHLLKSAAHAPIAVYVALADGRAEAAAPLEALRGSLGAALGAVAAEIADASLAACARAALEASRALVTTAIERGGVDRAALDAFARATGPGLLRLTDAATGLQLEALHAAVEEALAALAPDELRALQVVVVGDHQARERSLAMQYFRKRLGEPAGAEERVAYAEGVTDVSAARALVGKRRLDRAIACAFFGDDKRLQRDVLGDAAKARLDAVDLASIPR